MEMFKKHRIEIFGVLETSCGIKIILKVKMDYFDSLEVQAPKIGFMDSLNTQI